jgi:hypothetical protein
MDIIDFAESTDWEWFAHQKELLLTQQKEWNEWLEDDAKKFEELFSSKEQFLKNKQWLIEKLEKLDGLINFLDSLQDLLCDEYGFKPSLIFTKTLSS